MSTKLSALNEAELRKVLGAAFPLWGEIIATVENLQSPIDQTWKASKMAFGKVCLLQYKKRTLLYMIPDDKQIWIAVVLGERAYGLAMGSALPTKIKTLFAEARPYAEGRGIRFAVKSARDIGPIKKLMEIKLTPK
jgi:hypothetical protein